MQVPEKLIDGLLAGRDVAADLSGDERRVLLRALQEYAGTGDSQILNALWRVDYIMRPPSPAEFLSDPNYLGVVCQDLYPEWRGPLIHVLSPENEICEWILDGAIGTGKTTKAVIALLYKMMLLFLMRNPQQFYGLLPNSPLVVALFNIFKYLADDTAYATMISYMNMSPYFREAAKAGKKSRRVGDQYHELPQNVGICIGRDAISALGQNIIMGLLDEANFRATARRREREQQEERSAMYRLYSSMENRIVSRFGQPSLLVLSSSANDEGDFTRRRKREARQDPHVHYTRLAIYHVKPRYKGQPVFRVYCGDRVHAPRILGEQEAAPADGQVELVPTELLPAYQRNIYDAIREISGLPVGGAGKFIEDISWVDQCVDPQRANPIMSEAVVSGVRDTTPIARSFAPDLMFEPLDVARTRFRPRHFPEAPRYLHVDLAENQCAGAMACVCPCLDTVSQVPTGDLVVWVDFLLRLRNAPGDRIDYAQVRAFVLLLRTLGLPIRLVTYDRFQSVDSVNLLTQAGIPEVGWQSVVKTIEPYATLRNAFCERRVLMPRHGVLRQELADLQREGSGVQQRIVCPADGSKDVADALAGAIFGCLTRHVRGAAGAHDAVARIGSGPGLTERPAPVNPFDRLIGKVRS